MAAVCRWTDYNQVKLSLPCFNKSENFWLLPVIIINVTATSYLAVQGFVRKQKQCVRHLYEHSFALLPYANCMHVCASKCLTKRKKLNITFLLVYIRSFAVETNMWLNRRLIYLESPHAPAPQWGRLNFLFCRSYFPRGQCTHPRLQRALFD